MSSNGALATKVLRELARLGVREFAVAAGARNAPLIAPLLASEGFVCRNFFDERSAAFFALGRALAEQKPVAIVTTSGTAVGELLPAVMEAHYQGLPLVLVTARSPEPEEPAAAPRTLRDAVWLPFLECLSRHRAVEILVFVVLYKLADALSQSLLRPFLIDMGYGEFDRGFVLGTAGVALTIAGTFLGGLACTKMGLGHALWVFGFLQAFSNLGYILITYWPGGRPVMYGAMAFEMVTSGLGMGAFGVLLLRITEKRFSATQYALFSSLFGLPRILGGPITGLIVDAAGWRTFFWITIAAGAPGLVLLQRFAPLGTREPRFTVETVEARRRMTGRQIARRGVAGAIATALVGGLWMIGLVAVKAYRKDPAAGFDLPAAVAAFFRPATVGGWTQLVAILVVGVLGGLGTAALLTARHGDRAPDQEAQRVFSSETMT